MAVVSRVREERPDTTRRSLVRTAFNVGILYASSKAEVIAASLSASARSGYVVVDTQSGKIRGWRSQRVCAFKGVPYGASTAGVNRFLPPQLPVSWTGVRDALTFGPMAMQPRQSWSCAPQSCRVLAGNMDPGRHVASEDCLRLNIWTAGLEDGGRRPVMFWCHGGSFDSGMGDAPWHDGEHLAKNHDVVVVHFNHRLHLFGFLYLGHLQGNPFPMSGNVGMLDIVAALRWVRTNIAKFGGDPNNVTIFGESGGGGKVATLMGMPEAEGLFHRAIIQSGSSMIRAIAMEDAIDSSNSVLQILGISADKVQKLCHVPADRLLAVKNQVALGLARTNPYRRTFEPVVDGEVLLRHPFDPRGPDCSADVPLLIGTNADEARVWGNGDTTLFRLGRAQLQSKLRELGDFDEPSALALSTAYESFLPKASASDVLFAVLTDRMMRSDAILIAGRKAAVGRGGCFMYQFNWNANDEYRAGHGIEVPFVFDNLENAPGLGGAHPSQSAAHLALQVSSAWVAFARTGNPSTDLMPKWEAYEKALRSTMLLGSECFLGSDPEPQRRRLMEPFGIGPLNR